MNFNYAATFIFKTRIAREAIDTDHYIEHLLYMEQ